MTTGIHHPNGDSNALELVLTTPWCIWSQRNKVIFEGITPNPMDTILTIKSFVNRFMHHKEDNPQPEDLTLPHIKPHWTPNADWQLLIIVDGGGLTKFRWKSIAFIGKDRHGQTQLVGCQSTRLMHNKVAKLMAIYEAATTTISLGYTNIIMLVDSKELEILWTTNSFPNWQLQPIFEDLLYLKLHRNLLLTIKLVPKPFLADTKALVSVACNHFVNVSSTSLNSNL